ncbi:MAG: beta-lactamase family protein [Proteobacteria bacterium]|nr:beta-lactamase family protein [Pseudomonadota bacterium]MCP4916903.1 beta-lactamase family protein [Pseudomonadota bacterium]
MLALLLACTPSDDTNFTNPVEPEDTATWDPRFDPIAEAFKSELATHDAPGVAVAILEDGEIVWTAAFGQRGPEGDEALTPHALFRIGSVTKMLTAQALVVERDEGRLTLEDPVQDWVDVETVTPDRYPSTTLHHLLSHQGGFYDHTPIEGSAGDNRLAAYTEGTWANSYSIQMVDPGTFWNYSNPNFALAGLVAERSNGQAYREVVAANVLEPHGMSRTFFLADEVEADGDYATGKAYDWTGGSAAWLPAGPDAYDHAWSRPAGFAWSSTSDLLRFADFLMTEQGLLTDAYVDFEVGYPGTFFYGYGVMVYEGFNSVDGWVDAPVWTHGGAIPGFSADLYMLPDEGLAIAVLANGDGAYFGNSIAVAFDELAELPYGTMPDAGDRDDLERYPGTYHDPYNIGTCTIGLEDALTIACPTLENYGYDVGEDLIAAGQDNFLMTLNGQYLQIALLAGPDHDSQYLRHRAFVGHRVDEAIAPLEQPVPDRELLARVLRTEENSRARSTGALARPR